MAKETSRVEKASLITSAMPPKETSTPSGRVSLPISPLNLATISPRGNSEPPDMATV